MKANELMIGDWIEPHQCRIPTVYARVEGIYPDGITIDKAERVFSFDEIHPIPLTPEILEKNGFSDESRHCHGEPLRYCVLVDGLWIDINGKNYFEGKLEYVHQLQHALRICGIEKEIEL